MKRLFFYILAVTMISIGCRKTVNDKIGGQTPDQRLSAALAAYQKKLTGAPYGWIFLESTTGVAFNQGVSQNGPKAVFSYFMQFIDSNNVLMFSDFDTSMSATPKTSGFRVKALTRPALIFDTYSYLHVPCDPDPSISRSPFGTGYGWGTDFEFSFADSTVPTDAGDTVRLTGNLNSASGVLIKATQQQRDAYLSGALKSQMSGLLNILEYFKRLSYNGVVYEIRINADRTITFTWTTGGQSTSQTVSFYTTAAGIVLITPVVNGSLIINSLDNLTWDPVGSVLSVSINGQHGSVAGATAPANNDINVPQRWWTTARDNGLYWASFSGFHVNGVDDAYGVRKLSDTSGIFYYYAYFPDFFSNPADAFLPINVKGNRLVANDYFTAAGSPPTFTGNGKIIFTELGFVGTIPPGGAVDKSDALLYDPAGFYLVQTGPLSYDMVIATNARAWISWVWPQ
ncbi:DUF4302 domain-containing protein [Flavitalea flava]